MSVLLSAYIAIGAAVAALSLGAVLVLDWRAGNDRRLRARPSSLRRGTRPEISPGSGSEDEDWLHAALMEAYGLEREAWALARVERVAERLQADRPAAERLRVEILWIPQVNAFTTDAPYVYVSRRLLERCASEEPVALAVAHEIAHHDLGHVALFRGWRSRLPRGVGGKLLATAVWLLERRLYSPDQERDADARALDLCVAAGYDAERCIRLFDVLESHLLDHGDLDGVYGPDLETEDDGRGAEWARALKQWVHERERGYPSIQERRERLLARARELRPVRTAPA